MKSRTGFTIIEVSLFLAITGLLMLAVTVGVQNSVFQQRYNDSVQNFVEFLRSAYSETTNVQSVGDGNSNIAIYGKLITFGETVNLNGADVNKPGKENVVFMYDVIGEVSGNIGSGGILGTLSSLNANVFIEEGNRPKLAGVATSYTPKWGARIQKTDGTEDLKGAVLIVRHPSSGTVYTFTMEGTTIPVNEVYKQSTAIGVSDFLKQYLNEEHFKMEKIDFCVNPNETINSRNNRADVRIDSGARGSSSIGVYYDVNNACRLDT